jgi:c-di-GMP-binding flagellar brake protein YcgR
VDDRRKYPRVNAPVFCRPIGKPLFGRRKAADVSLGGMRLFSDEAPDVGDRLKLELFVSGEEALSCSVEVVWVERLPDGSPAKFDVGVRFVELSAELRERLAAVLKPE